MKRFKKVYIEITNVCNLSCNFCPKTNREAKFMNVDNFESIIKKVKLYTDYIYLHLMGEPFLNENLEKFLYIAKENNLKVNITTNGTLLEKVKNILIKDDLVRQINISLHSFEANNSNINMKDYIKSVTSFVNEANEKSNIICSLRLWNMDNDELKANNELNDSIFKILENKFDIDFSLSEKLALKNGVKIKKNLYLNMAEKFSWPNIDIEGIHDKGFCYGLRDQIGILVDGTVVPCCLDSDGNINLGNIFLNDLEDILNSKRAKNLYDGFSKRIIVEDLCKKCGYIKRYK